MLSLPGMPGSDGLVGAWTDGRAHLVLYRDGKLALYEGSRRAWHWPAIYRGSGPLPSTVARLRELAGWPEGAIQVVGPYALIAGPGQTLELWQRSPKLRKLEGDLSGAYLCGSPLGIVLSDSARRELRLLPDGPRIQLKEPLASLLGAAVPNGFVAIVHEHGSKLVRLDTSGEVIASREVSCPRALWVTEEAVFALVEEMRYVALLQAFDPLTLAPLRSRPTRFQPLEAEQAWLSSAGDVAVLTNGWAAWAMEASGGNVRSLHSLERPTRDPSDGAGEPRLPSEALLWQGPPGPFRVEGILENQGRNATGFRLRSLGAGPVWLERAWLDDRPGVATEGGFHFPTSTLRCATPCPLVIEGAVYGPALLDLAVEYGEGRIGTVHLVLEASLGLRCERGEEGLPFESAWLDELQSSEVLDMSAPAPDLARWRARAETRGRGDAARTEALFLELSRDDRERESPPLVPAFKFTPGGPWQITTDEARRIAEALGPGHPLGRFAQQGPFLVRSA